MVKWSDANAKIEALQTVESLKKYLEGKKVYSFDLLSGFSCPFAHDCLSKAVEDSEGKRTIKDGPHTKFRCFSASQEVQYNGVYNLRKHNFDTLRQSNNMDLLLMDSLPKDTGIVRIHVAGDFFNADYMRAWYNVAYMNPSILFYGYTKSLRYWQFHINEYPELDNLVLTASYGGSEDNLIGEYNLRSTKVVFSEFEAYKLGLEIDSDDSHAARPDLRNQNFALLIHGVQPKGSEAAKALVKLKGQGSYNRKEKVNVER